MTPQALSRPVASAAVEAAGWRLLYKSLAAAVPVDSVQQGLEVAAAAAAACGDHADAHLRVDLRPDRVSLSVSTFELGVVTARDTELAGEITAAVHGLGKELLPATGGHPPQLLEIAIDAVDIPAIRPFWLAVLGYAPEPGSDVMPGSIVDPAGELPNLWFQQMDEPRPQRNRIHFDLHVPHDEADRRIAAAIDAGGKLVSDAAARSFWILADAEGNEICICTWEDRERG